MEPSEIDDLVRSLLGQAGVERPPVEPLRVLERLDLERVEVKLPKGAESLLVQIKDRSTLYFDEGLRPERLNFRVAHEIFEVLLSEEDDERERLCNMGASRLLPTDWFRRECHLVSFDLHKLKKTFSTASHEVIAYRTLDFRPGVVTLLDNGAVTRRVGSRGFAHPRSLHPAEEGTARLVMEKGEHLSVQAEGLQIDGWPVFEEDWRRVILITTLD